MLLEDITDLATNNNQPIAVLLRKCIILAHQIRNERLKVWANNELNGYTNNDELPDYRIVSAQARGHFSGWGGSQLNHFTIPPAVLDEKHRRFATTVHLAQAIAAYEDLVKSAKANGKITLHWPADLVLHYQERIPLSQPMAFVAAYQEIPKSALIELLDTVRNRVLNMALEIQSEVGESDEDLKRLTPNAEAKIEGFVNQQIFNGNVYIASGESSITIQQQSIAVGNWNQLEQALRSSGISQPEFERLADAMAQDGGKMGSTVLNWIKTAGPNILSGGVRIGANVGQVILTEFLKRYFGLN